METKVDKKVYKLNSSLIPIFSGTYETIWQVTEYEDEDGNAVYAEYDHSGLMKSIVGIYHDEQETITDNIKVEVNFIDKIEFTQNFSSPREYNFRTDVIDFNLTIDMVKLNNQLDKLETDNKFHKFLKDNYTSYDGFMSFTPNNFSDIKSEIINDGGESDQSISAAITYLLSQDDVNCFEYNNKLTQIEMDMYEIWSCNGYNGLEYTLVKD